MVSLEEKLQKWIVLECNGLCEGRMVKIPDTSSLSKLTEGKNQKIWKYLTKYVKSRHSVENVKSILRLRQSRKELHHIYRPTIKNDVTDLKQELLNSQEKIQFVENSLKGTKCNIFSFKDSVRKLKEEACILNQKCALLELVALGYEENNKILKNNLEQLRSLLNYVEKFQFANSFQAGKLKESNCLNYINEVKYILYQISEILESKFLGKDSKTPSPTWNKSELFIRMSLNDVIHILKELSKKANNLLKAEDAVTGNISQSLRKAGTSRNYLQQLKFLHVSSYFHSKEVLNHISKLNTLANKQINLQASNNTAHHEFYLVKSENESLIEGIKYLEEALADICNETKHLENKYKEQKAHWEQHKPILHEFSQKLKTVQLFLNTNRQTFFDVRKALLTSNEFTLTVLLDNVTSNNITFVSSAEAEIKSDFEMAVNLIDTKDFLQPLLLSPNFEDSNIPESLWALIPMPVYQNRRLICQKLIHLKKMLCLESTDFVVDNNINMKNKHSLMLNQLQDIIKRSKCTEKEYQEKIKETETSLKVAVNEWWEQKAQFIPEINCQGKSLKMWLDVLHVLEDF